MNSKIRDADTPTSVDNRENVVAKKLKLSSEKSFSTIKIRLVFAIVLVAILLVYLFSALVYSFLIKNTSKASWLDLFAYIHLLISFLILGGATYELSNAFGFKKWYIHMVFIILASIIFYFPITIINSNYPAWIFISWSSNLKSYITLIWFLIVLVFVIVSIMLFVKNNNFVPKDIFLFVGYVLVVALGLKGITALALTPVNGDSNSLSGGHSVATIIWIWIMAIASDTIAYFIGVKWGKTKLAPVVSPKKSIEGAIGGFIGAFIIGVVFASILVFAIPNNPSFIPFKAFISTGQVWNQIMIIILFSIIVPILSIFGDLFFSILKRKFDIKDYSQLLPGHGGVLDRLDSILFTAFVMEIIILILN